MSGCWARYANKEPVPAFGTPAITRFASLPLLIPLPLRRDPPSPHRAAGQDANDLQPGREGIAACRLGPGGLPPRRRSGAPAQCVPQVPVTRVTREKSFTLRARPLTRSFVVTSL